MPLENTHTYILLLIHSTEYDHELGGTVIELVWLLGIHCLATNHFKGVVKGLCTLKKCKSENNDINTHLFFYSNIHTAAAMYILSLLWGAIVASIALCALPVT